MLLPCLRPCRGFYVRHGLAPFVVNAVPSPLPLPEHCSCHANASVEVKSHLTFRKKDSCSVKVCRSRNRYGCDGPHVYAAQGGYRFQCRQFVPASTSLLPSRARVPVGLERKRLPRQSRSRKTSQAGIAACALSAQWSLLYSRKGKILAYCGELSPLRSSQVVGLRRVRC